MSSTKALRFKLASPPVCCLLASVFAALPAWARTPDEIYARAAPAVVKIVVYDSTGTKTGQGSGFFIGDGKIVTNAHVVENAYSAEVHGSLGLYENITILKEDEHIDLALLQVSDTGEPSIRLAAANRRLRAGQQILAIGNPMGWDRTLSNGMISAVRGLPGEFQVVQINAPISPGSSGGPLLDMEGRVVGVTFAGVSEGQNLNFAVGIETLQSFLSRSDSPRALKKAGEWVFWRAALKGVGNVIVRLITLVFGEGGFGWLALAMLIMLITAIVAGLKWLWRVVSSFFRRKTAQGLHSIGDSVGDDRVATSHRAYDDEDREQEPRTARADLFDDGPDDESEEFATAPPSIRVRARTFTMSEVGRSTDMLAVDCSCGKRIAVPARYAGKKVSCSACRAVVQVSPQTPPQLPSPASPQPRAPPVAKADERNRAEQSTRAPSSSFQASPPEPPLAPAMNRNSLAISSATGGFIGLASIPLKLGFVAILAAVAAIALGIFGLKSGRRTWAIIGIVCGCLTLLFIVAAVAMLFYEFQRYQQEFDSLPRW